MSNFTPEDLLEYFYKETDLIKTTAVQIALDIEWPLQQKYNVITQAAEKLDKSLIAPRKQSVKVILDHATKYNASVDMGL